MKQLVEVAYFTEDVASMASFYKKLLGDPVAASEDMAIFMSGNTKIFVHKTYDAEEGDLPPENHFAYGVDDVDKSCEQLQAAGLTLEVEPKDYYWGRSSYLRDPDGHLIEISKPKEYQG